MIYSVLGILTAVCAYAVARRPGAAAAGFGLGFLGAYLTLPTLAFGFWGVPWLVFVGLALGIVWRLSRREADTTTYASIVVTSVLAVGFLAVAFFTSAPMLHSDDLRALTDEVQESEFVADTAPIDPTQVRQVDRRYARRLGDKRLGEDTALGSQVELGDLNIQMIRGELYWAGPLNHESCFKWWSNRSGTPGFVLVSATNERDVRLVRETQDGSPIQLRYNMGSCFGDNPVRYLYENGYAATPLTDYTFEVDDATLSPHLVVTKYEKRVGFTGAEATGVVVLNLQTGAIDEYGIDDAPAWIDRIQPEALVADQLEDWGSYVHGWWNPSDRDKLQLTPGMSLVYGADGRSYWYSGLTSVGSDDATVGFVLVDTRTKQTRFYRQSGATETAAMASAEGSVQEKGYEATFPVLYNVAGAPTYFTSLKDQEGLVKMRAFISARDYQVVGVGEDVQSALRSYRRALISRGNAVSPETAMAWAEATGKVLRMTAEPRDGRVYYYLLLEGHEDRVFVGTSDLSVELPLTRTADVVQVRYEDGGGETVDLTMFDNTALTLRKRAEQEAVEHDYDLLEKDRAAERTVRPAAEQHQ